jgi:hypothetical protein
MENNRNETRLKVAVVQADGHMEIENRINKGDAGDLYPVGALELTDQTDPGALDNDSQPTGIVFAGFSGQGTELMMCNIVPRELEGGTLAYDAFRPSGTGHGYDDDGDDYGLVRFSVDQSGLLKRVTTFFLHDGTTQYTISVYGDLSGSNPVNLLRTQSDVNEGRGYREIELFQPLPVEVGQDFYSLVRYNTEGALSFPVPVTDFHAGEERSWISSDNGNFIHLTRAEGFPLNINIRAGLEQEPAGVNRVDRAWIFYP